MSIPDDQSARRRRTRKPMRPAVALTIAAAALLLTACGSDTETDSAPTSVAAQAQTCYPARAIDDPDLAAFAAGLELPPGVQVVTGRVSTDSDHPGQVGVAIDLCVPDSTSADALRPIATDIAKALRPTPLGERTFAFYVADMDSNYKADTKIKDPNFQVHLWNGKPSAKAEQATWEVVTG